MRISLWLHTALKINGDIMRMSLLLHAALRIDGDVMCMSLRLHTALKIDGEGAGVKRMSDRLHAAYVNKWILNEIVINPCHAE